MTPHTVIPRRERAAIHQALDEMVYERERQGRRCSSDAWMEVYEPNVRDYRATSTPTTAYAPRSRTTAPAGAGQGQTGDRGATGRTEREGG